MVESFSEFKDLKNIDRETMMRILEDVFRAMLIKKYGTDANIDIIVNIDKGDLEIWRNRLIVEDSELKDPSLEIPYSEAIKIEPDFEVGEEVSEAVRITDFGRREILSIRQNLISKVQDYEHNIIYKRYKERIGEIITGEVYQVWKREILVLDDAGVELVLPKSEQIPADFYRKGDRAHGRRRRNAGGPQRSMGKRRPEGQRLRGYRRPVPDEPSGASPGKMPEKRGDPLCRGRAGRVSPGRFRSGEHLLFPVCTG